MQPCAELGGKVVQAADLFVLQSREGAIDAVLDAPDGTWKSAADRLYMLSLDVQQSPMTARKAVPLYYAIMSCGKLTALYVYMSAGA